MAPLTPELSKTVQLATVLDMKAASPLADELLLARGSDLQVDGSAVQRIGAQCLQVLLAARQTWRADGATLVIVAPSEPLQNSVALLGATAALFDLVELRS